MYVWESRRDEASSTSTSEDSFRMLVPWNNEMLMMETHGVTSESVWDKFDLEQSLESDLMMDSLMSTMQQQLPDHEELTFSRSTASSSSSSSCRPLAQCRYAPKKCYSSEIRNHDCMWAGTCVSNEHKDFNMSLDWQAQAARAHQHHQQQQQHRKQPVQPGHSLLIQNARAGAQATTIAAAQAAAAATCSFTSMSTSSSPASSPEPEEQDRCFVSCGIEMRPDTPQSMSSSCTESEDDEATIFDEVKPSRIDSIAKTFVPAHVVTNQHIQRQTIFPEDWRNHQLQQQQNHQQHTQQQQQQRAAQEAMIRSSTMSDHCYHLNQPSPKSLERLGVPPTPSDTEEEIDVVSCEKPRYPASNAASVLSLPTQPSPAEQQHYQHTVNSALKQRPQRKATTQQQQQQQPTTPTTPPPAQQQQRARGRPPSNGVRKRNVQVPTTPSSSVEKKRGSAGQSSGGRRAKSARHLYEDELSTEKRNQHNNMERKRRIHLRSMFDDLRKLVPELVGYKFAPKVKILSGAASMCRRLTKMDQKHLVKLAELQDRQRQLQQHMANLQMELGLAVDYEDDDEEDEEEEQEQEEVEEELEEEEDEDEDDEEDDDDDEDME